MNIYCQMNCKCCNHFMHKKFSLYLAYNWKKLANKNCVTFEHCDWKHPKNHSVNCSWVCGFFICSWLLFCLGHYTQAQAELLQLRWVSGFALRVGLCYTLLITHNSSIFQTLFSNKLLLWKIYTLSDFFKKCFELTECKFIIY